jgi:hypothetical protein
MSMKGGRSEVNVNLYMERKAWLWFEELVRVKVWYAYRILGLIDEVTNKMLHVAKRLHNTSFGGLFLDKAVGMTGPWFGHLCSLFVALWRTRVRSLEHSRIVLATRVC